MIKQLKKVERLVGEKYETQYDYKQKAIKCELLYSTEYGYYISAYAVTKNTDKKYGYTSESTMLFNNGGIKLRVDNGRICKSRTEKAIEYFDKVCQNGIEAVLNNNPQFAE